MKRMWTNLFIVVLAASVAVMTGCATKPAETRPPAPAGGAASPPEGASGLEGLAEERKAASVADYQMAAKLHAENKDSEALSYAQQAVQEDSTNIQAQALLTEIRKALGGTAPASAEGGFREIEVQRQMLQRDMTEKFASGEKNLREGNYAQAVNDFKEVLRIIRIGRLLLDAGDTEARAKELLKQAEDKKREQDVIAQRQRDEAARIEIEKAIAQKQAEKEETLKRLWIEYEAAKSRGDYDRAKDTLEAIMQLDAEKKDTYLRTMVALEAERAQWQKRKDYEDLKMNIQMEMNGIDESAIPYEKVFNYGDREEWRNEVVKRAQRIMEMSRVTTTRTPEDQRVMEMVEGASSTDFNTSTIITRPGRPEGSPPDLVDVVNYLKKMHPEIAFDIDPNLVNDPAASQPINLELPGTMSLISLLNNIQGQLQTVAWRVEQGAVMFKRKDEAAELVVRPYDVSDIVCSIQDFPGAPVGVGAASQTTPGGGPVTLGAQGEENVNVVNQFTMDNLLELIKTTTGGGAENWATSPTETNRPDIQNYQDTILWVRQTEAGHAEIETMLARLRSLSGLLVSIEARFITVEKNFLQAVGIDWRDLGPIDPLQLLRVLQPGTGGGTGQATILPDTTHNIPNVVPATSSGIFWSDSRSDIGARIDNIVNASILDSPLDSSGGTSIQLQILDKISFEAIIHAVRKDSRRQVLTAPRIMCFNAQQASIFVGTQQTYIRSYNTGTGGVSKPVLDLVDGPTVVFDVRPVVSADRRYITLYLRPVITFEPILKAIPFRRGSDATGAPIVLQVFLPQLDRQELRTVVMVPDGGTVLIGGLKNADELYRRNEVPVLGKLPILGWFFRSEVEANSKKELLILVTAKIIAIDEQEADM